MDCQPTTFPAGDKASSGSFAQHGQFLVYVTVCCTIGTCNRKADSNMVKEVESQDLSGRRVVPSESVWAVHNGFRIDAQISMMARNEADMSLAH